MPSRFLEKIRQAEMNTDTTPVKNTTNPTQPIVQQTVRQTVQPQDNTNLIYNKLVYAVRNNGLGMFYNNETLINLAKRLNTIPVQKLAQEFKINPEVAVDLYQLALYNVVILADDSGSMQQDDRIDELKEIIGRVAKVAGWFDEDGLDLCFLNHAGLYSKIKDSASVLNVVQNINFSGRTPLGNVLRNRVWMHYVIEPLNNKQLQKPVLVIVITDGEPDNKNDVFNAILEANNYNKQGGTSYVEFEFAQVGNDERAQQFLDELDNHPIIGDIVDVTSNFEIEEGQCKKKGYNLTPSMWLLKLMLGTIDPEYDVSDE